MVAVMILDFSTTRLRASTIAIEDPGPLPQYLPHGQTAAAFLRRGDGFVALGEVARFETDYADAADVWWGEVAASIDHDTELPGEYGIGPLAVGSFTFDPERSKQSSVLIVPEIIIGRRYGKTWLTRVGDENLNAPKPQPGQPPSPPTGLTLVSGSASQHDWTKNVSTVVDLIKAGEARKVVLARDLIATAEEPIDERYLVARLAELYPKCWTYLVDQTLGATPELLVRRQGALATSRVLAGTVSIDPDVADQVQRAATLARSEKDLAEHQFAVESVAESLAPFCSAMNVPESASVLALPNVLHLATDITGVCEPEASALALAAALHPSAAVCGTPMHSALTIINDHETLDRGRYAGPIGWVDTAGDGEWMIALRGGQLTAEDPTSIQLFAGAGLVAASQPEAELAETRAKFVPMLQALGLEPTP